MLSEKSLEEQVVAFLKSITIPAQYAALARQEIRKSTADVGKAREVQLQSLDATIAMNRRKADNLRSLRIADHISQEEFLRDREGLEMEYLRLTQAREQTAKEGSWIEPAGTVVDFTTDAASALLRLLPGEKRLVVEICGSNPTLKDRELRIDAASPFRRWSGNGGNSSLCAQKGSNLRPRHYQ